MLRLFYLHDCIDKASKKLLSFLILSVCPMCLQFLANLLASPFLIHLPALSSLLQSTVRTQRNGKPARDADMSTHGIGKLPERSINFEGINGGPPKSPLSSK
jgi:hypothetical protein